MKKDTHHSDDAKAKMRAAKAGRAGRPKKLTEDQVREMRALRAQGVKPNEIAQRFGVSRVTVYRTCAGKSWAHLDQPGPESEVTHVTHDSNEQFAAVSDGAE